MKLNFWSRRPRSGRPYSRLRFVRPRLEGLEDRCLLSGGALDPTFGSGGIVTTAVGPTTEWGGAAAVAVYPNAGTANDGKIVAAGNAPTGMHAGSLQEGFAVARYNPNGTLDSSFGSGGQLTTPIGNGNDRANGVAVQTDGKIVAAGYGADSSGNSAITVVRYNPNGSLDTTFGSGKTKGIVQTHVSRGSTDGGEALALQADGKIVVAGTTTPQGSSSSQFALVRYNTNGSLDTTFNGSGTAVSNFTGSASGNPYNAVGLAIYPSTSAANAGKIVVAGQLRNADGTYSLAVLRYNANGSPDTTFGGGSGYVLLNTPSNPVPGVGSDSLPHVAIQADDRLDVAFTNDGGATTEISVARLQADGSLDTSFGTGGVVVTQHQMWDAASSVALETNGEIVVAGTEGEAGSANEPLMLALFNSMDGSLDTTFGVNGFQTAPVQMQNSYGVGVAIQPDGKIVAAGTQDVRSTNGYTDFAFALARFLPSQPQIGSFTAGPNPVSAGSSVTPTAGNIRDADSGATTTQGAFDPDGNNDGTPESGSDRLSGHATQTGPDVWAFSSAIKLAPGSHTLFSQAEDGYGAFGDPRHSP